MCKTYLPYGPGQQWLPDDHLAHFISGVVDQVDLSDITARHEREMRGGPPYHPRGNVNCGCCNHAGADGAYCRTCAAGSMAKALDLFFGGQRKRLTPAGAAQAPAPSTQHRLLQ